MSSTKKVQSAAPVPRAAGTAERFTPGMRLVKRLFDVAGAGLLILLLSPVLAFVALAILATCGRPVLFKQERIGRMGRHFTLYKFRTMVRGAEGRLDELHERSEVPGPVFKMRRDPRTTGLGLLLRFFSVDELPQLFNVLKGEMSLVGPRPALPAEVRRYPEPYRRRLLVRPGMTCTWQVSGRSTIPFDQWVAMDLAYIDNWTLLQDVAILVQTIPAVLFCRGAQ